MLDSVSKLGSSDAIYAGQTVELEMFSNSGEAESGVWIIEKIMYQQATNQGTVMLMWENPKFIEKIEEILGENVLEDILSQ